MSEPKIHELKCWPEFFEQVLAGRKTVEIRRDDRGGFAVGDVLDLQEWVPEGYGVHGYMMSDEPTGRSCRVHVTHVLRGAPWVPDGYVAMSVRLNAAPDAGDVEALAAIVRPLVERGIVSPKAVLSVGKDAILALREAGNERAENAVADVLDFVSGWCRPKMRIEPQGSALPSVCTVCNASLTGRAIRAVAETTGMIHWSCPDCGHLLAMEPLYPTHDVGDVEVLAEDERANKIIEDAVRLTAQVFRHEIQSLRAKNERMRKALRGLMAGERRPIGPTMGEWQAAKDALKERESGE